MQTSSRCVPSASTQFFVQCQDRCSFPPISQVSWIGLKPEPPHEWRWMCSVIASILSQNMLRSNAEKTEVILFTSRFTKTPNIEKLFFDSTVIELTEKVRDLGVILHKNLTPTYHINETYRKATNAIRSIGRIRKYLTNKNLKLLVNALVISRLDYCNSILYGLPKRELDKLQRVQNTAAGLIKQYDHIKPAPLQKLHWLRVESRIIFKVILITFKILHGLSPAYLSSLLPSLN